jgi:hypothetical protein
MENPPPSSAGPYSAPAPAAQHQDAAKEDQDVAQLVLNLCIPELREKAIIILSKVNDPSFFRCHRVRGGGGGYKKKKKKNPPKRRRKKKSAPLF